MKTNNDGIIIPDYLIVIKWLENGGKCMSDLHRELDITYKHLHELKHTFLKLEWVTIKKDQRRHNLYLTKKGKDVAHIATWLLLVTNTTMKDVLHFIEEGKLKKDKLFEYHHLIDHE